MRAARSRLLAARRFAAVPHGQLRESLELAEPIAASPSSPAHTSALLAESIASSRDASPGPLLTFAYDTPIVNGVTLPIVLGIGALAYAGGDDILLQMTTAMWMHELGHAIVAWLGGFFAVPLPFLTIAPSEDRSLLVILLVALALGVGAFFAYRSGRRAVLALLVGLAILQVVLSAVLNTAQATKWVIFAGLAGEIVLPALIILMFYLRLPGRWDFWRYPAVVLSGVTYARELLLWVGVARGSRWMPHGSAMGDDSMGDVERLASTYHWPAHALADDYVHIAYACLAAIALTYAIFLPKALVMARPPPR
jgi:hypothetical protein